MCRRPHLSMHKAKSSGRFFPPLYTLAVLKPSIPKSLGDCHRHFIGKFSGDEKRVLQLLSKAVEAVLVICEVFLSGRF